MATNADTKISLLGPANTLTGTELVPMTQNISGILTTVRATTQQIQQQLGISANNPMLTGQAIITTGTNVSGLVLNNTNGFLYFIQPQNSGVTRGYWGADATYCFRVANAAGTLATLLLDNTGAMTLPGVLTVNGISNTGTITSTGLVTAGGGIAGRTTAPAAGTVGELVSQTPVTTGLTTNTATSVSSISLTAGVWDITGSCQCTPSATMTVVAVAVNATTNTLPGAPLFATVQSTSSLSTTCLTAPTLRVVLTSTTTYYLVVLADFTSGTVSALPMLRATRIA